MYKKWYNIIIFFVLLKLNMDDSIFFLGIMFNVWDHTHYYYWHKYHYKSGRKSFCDHNHTNTQLNGCIILFK